MADNVLRVIAALVILVWLLVGSVVMVMGLSLHFGFAGQVLAVVLVGLAAWAMVTNEYGR